VTAVASPPLHIVTSYPGPLAEHFLLARLSAVWRDQGYSVSVGPLARLDRGLGLLHIDSTRLAPAQLPAVVPPARLLNRRVLDISKRGFSRLLLQADSPWDGPVIIKTDANFHGLPEASARPPGWLERLRRQLPWRLARQLPARDYPVLPHRDRVPAWVWRRRDLVVERFVPERAGRNYVLRMYLFFGDRGVVYRMEADRPIIKAQGIVGFETTYDEPPPEIAEARRALGFDFGKFDYVLYEGRPVLLDINKTPAVSGKRRERTAYLAGGLDRILAEGVG
jgi:hypothetical protein